MATGVKRQFVASELAQDEEVITFHKQLQKQCTECGAKATPQWRQGPQGPQTLCNACGVRYSRLHRRSKAPKKHAADTANAAPKEHLTTWKQEEEHEQDSDGLTTFLPPPVFVQGSPTVTTTINAPPTAAPAFHAASPLSAARAVRTNLPLLQPSSPASAAIATPNSRRSARMAQAQAADRPTQQSPAGSSSEYDMDCEAANMLLSMAAGAAGAAGPRKERKAPAVPVEEHAPPALLQRVASTGPATAQRQASVEALSAVQTTPPALQPAEFMALQQLCTVFDDRFKELVAAQVACNAVEQVLHVKQEEARLARAAARSAAQLLMTHAAQLAHHEVVQQALATQAAKIEALRHALDGSEDALAPPAAPRAAAASPAPVLPPLSSAPTTAPTASAPIADSAAAPDACPAAAAVAEAQVQVMEAQAQVAEAAQALQTSEPAAS